MSLHALLESIRISGEEQIREIQKQARKQVDEILKETRPEAEAIKEQACRAAMDPAIKERARIIHRARLEALQTIGGVRESLVDTTLEQTHGRLSGIRCDAIYHEVLRMLLHESLDELKSDWGSFAKFETELSLPIRLEVDERDRSSLDSLLSDLRLDLPVSYCLDTWGGLIAKSEDGRIVVINTLEARLERATPYLRRYLAAIFENELLEQVENTWLTKIPAL